MAQLIQFEVKELPQLFLVGKEIRYSMDAHMKGDNRIPGFWQQCLQDGTLDILEAEKEPFYENAQVGIMMDWKKGDGDFSYIIGMLFANPFNVSDGYIERILPQTKAVVGWIKGKDTMDCCSVAHELTQKEAETKGYNVSDMQWCMELYNCTRFTTPDENGDIILDYYIPCIS